MQREKAIGMITYTYESQLIDHLILQKNDFGKKRKVFPAIFS